MKRYEWLTLHSIDSARKFEERLANKEIVYIQVLPRSPRGKPLVAKVDCAFVDEERQEGRIHYDFGVNGQGWPDGEKIFKDLADKTKGLR